MSRHENARYFIWWLMPKFSLCRLSGWNFEWLWLMVWKETRYYRSTGYFISIQIYWKDFDWEKCIKKYTPTAEEMALLDSFNNYWMDEHKRDEYEEYRDRIFP